MIVLISACNSKKTSDNAVPIFDTTACLNNYDLLAGNWQSLDFWTLYCEIEIMDSMRCYIDQGDYVGPTTAEEIIIKNDTLTWYSVGYRICIQDSSTIRLKSIHGVVSEWRRIYPALSIRDWKKENDSAYNADFLHREREFKKLAAATTSTSDH